MIGRFFLSGLAGLVLAASGCDHPPPAPPTPVATTVPATIPATLPSTDPATSQPTASLININGHLTVFPLARLRLESNGQHLVALLYSDDPRDALKDTYTGNSFYLRMELDVDEASELADANWHYVAPSAGDREDSPYGIYLGGRKLQLQPYDVRGRFKKTEEGTAALISGQFEIVDESTDRGPGKVLPVAAELPVRIDSDAKPFAQKPR